MAGYYRYSMSNNAKDAYKNGIMPYSKWTKKAILRVLKKKAKKEKFEIKEEHWMTFNKMPVKQLKDILLYYSEWHHTSSWYNKTDFYALDYDPDEDYASIPIEHTSKRDIEVPTEEVWKCKYLEWSGTRSYPKSTEHESWGVIKGEWFYMLNGSCIKKKSIYANGFVQLEKFECDKIEIES